MQIITYQEKYKQQIIDLILDIQNNEAKINLSLEEQPDLLDIPICYEKDGGEFWLAVEGDKGLCQGRLPETGDSRKALCDASGVRKGTGAAGICIRHTICCHELPQLL